MAGRSLLQLFNVNGVSYPDFLKQMNDVMVNLKEAEYQELSEYVKPGYQKLNRAQTLYQEFDFNPDFISQLNNSGVHDGCILVITCGWTDDAIEVLPVIAKIIDACKGLKMRCIHVDHFPEIAKHYLPGGGYDDPQLIFLDEKTGKQLGSWGPRPDPLQKMVKAFMVNPDGRNEDMVKALKYWYQVDEGKTIEEEIARWVIQISNQHL